MFLPMQIFCEEKMGSYWQNWQVKAKNLLMETFYFLTINLLNILLPLSFLLLARISFAQYILSILPYPSSDSESSSYSFFLFSLFLYTSPALLYILVSTVSIATLIHTLTGIKLTVLSESPPAGKIYYQPRLYTAWIFLCTLQVCVGLGIEGSIAAGVEDVGASFVRGGNEGSLISRVIFFLGLHETMRIWSRTVVKPVVDDTCYGGEREERWVDRVALAMSLGGLWWWKLRDEVESLVVVAEVKKEMLMSVGVADFVGWWLYYLTVTIAMVRVVKGLLWLAMILLCRRVRRNNAAGDSCQSGDDKV